MNNQQQQNNNKKLFIASIIGNVFEMFDFFVFVFLSSIIAELFFPSNIGGLSLIFTYVTITISYLLRPIGGIILGNFGDTYGRKSVFTLSILLTSIPSLVIGLLPTYAHIGYLAPALLILSRILQGFSSGAELPGAITFIAEKYSQKNYYYYCAWIPFGANINIAICILLIKFMTNSMSHDFLYSYGWRIPFIFGGLLAFIGYYIRTNITETKQFQVLKQKHQLKKIPVLTLFAQYKPALILGTLMALPVTLFTSVFHIFLPNLFVKYLNLNLEYTIGISSVGALTLAIFILLFASITSKFNPVRIIQITMVGLVILFGLILSNYLVLDSIKSLYLIVVLVSVLIAGTNGIYSGIFVDLFPPQVRYSGIAACFSIAATIGGGLTPLWTSAVLSLTNSYKGIILVCILVSIISLINSYYLGKYLKNIRNIRFTCI